MNKTKEANTTENVSSGDSSLAQTAPLIKVIQDPSNVEGLRHEYSEVNNDIRNHSTLRFSIFTVYLVALGGLSSVAFGFFEFKYGNPEQIKFWGRLGGLFVTLLFFYYELRIQSLINHNLEVGRELESLLKYCHISSRPSWGKGRSHNATNIFFLILVIFWLVLALKML